MPANKRLIIGACGQIGTDLTITLREKYGIDNVVTVDLREPDHLLKEGHHEKLDALNPEDIKVVLKKHEIAEVYLLAAMLSATGEKNPAMAWHINTQSLVNLLELAHEGYIQKLFWPSSIAVFGPGARKYDCPQESTGEPSTIYGMSKHAGESLCNYYHKKFVVDVRSLRYPGLIGHRSLPGGGTTDYAVDIFHAALKDHYYTCFLEQATTLPMMYMPDAVRAAMELMEAPAAKIEVRKSYNLSAMSFAPQEIAASIKQFVPGFTIDYAPD